MAGFCRVLPRAFSHVPLTMRPVTLTGNLPKLGGYPILQQRNFCVPTEIYAAKYLFKSLKSLFPGDTKVMEKIGEVHLQILSPPIGDVFWNPSEHASLAPFVEEVIGDESSNYKIGHMKAEYDFNNSRVKVITPACFKKYLTMPKRGPLRIELPRDGHFEKAFRLRGFMPDQVSEKLIHWCKNKFIKAEVTEQEVEEHLEKVKKAGVDLQGEEMTTTAIMREFREADVEMFAYIVESLKEDGVPNALINTINISGCMGTNEETLFDFDATGWKLNLHLLKIIWFHREGRLDMLLALSHTSLKMSKEEQLDLSVSQVEALRAYAHTMAALRWKPLANDLI